MKQLDVENVELETNRVVGEEDKKYPAINLLAF
jgi:hypothetical protein